MTASNDLYELLDCGHGRKLERYGSHVLDRPVNYAVWPPRAPGELWNRAHGVYLRSDKGGGEWAEGARFPETWTARHGGLKMQIKPTPFGHTGLFPEQADNWGWLRDRAGEVGPEGEILNLFAYTGGSTLACAQGGSKVCHVDSSKGVVSWARENADLNELKGAPIRWIVDDVRTFVARELRRNRVYKGVIMDPPSYGRGAKGQVFKIEDDLLDLLAECWQLMGDSPEFFLLSCHSASFSPRVLGQVLARSAPMAGHLEVGEMVVPGAPEGPELPSGVFARWRAHIS